MLYARPTGAAPPAPQSEYVMVAAVEDAGQAWVEILAGIDVNPAALTLPSVPLKPIAERLMTGTLSSDIAGALGSGLPVLLLQFVDLHRAAGGRRGRLYEGHAIP